MGYLLGITNDPGRVASLLIGQFVKVFNDYNIEAMLEYTTGEEIPEIPSDRNLDGSTAGQADNSYNPPGSDSGPADPSGLGGDQSGSGVGPDVIKHLDE